jgi:MFS family permease
MLNVLTAGRTVIASGVSLLIIVLAKQQHASPLLIGTIFAMSALGVILGSLFSSQLHQRFGFRPLLRATTFLNWLIFTCYILASNTLLLTVITAVFYPPRA